MHGQPTPHLDRDDVPWTGDLGPWDPGARRASVPWWASPWLAAALGALLVVLVAVAILLPGGAVPPADGPGAAAPSATRGEPLSTAPSPSVAPTFVRPTPTPMPTFLAYTVQRGDSLTSIARQFGTTARSIAFWNRTRYASLDPLSPDYEPNRIQVGWTLLVIPGVEFNEDDAGPLPSSSSAP